MYVETNVNNYELISRLKRKTFSKQGVYVFIILNFAPKYES